MSNQRNKGAGKPNYRSRAKSQAAKDNYQDAEADWNRSKRGKNKAPSRSEGATVAIGTGSKDNDPSWYTKNPTILRNVASIGFGYVLGGLVEGNRLTFQSANMISQNTSVPGIMRLRWLPYVGTSVNGGSGLLGAAPINVAGEQAYSYLMKGKSVTKEFDPCDVTIFYLAMDSAFAYYAWLIRIYGVLTQYSATNKYTPRLLVQAMGVDFDEVVANLANFRLAINLYADRLSTMYVPKSVSYITRHIFMSQGIYMDSNNTKPQLYLYNPAAFYIFNELTTPAKLTLQTPGAANKGLIGTSRDQLLTSTDLIEFGNRILDPLIASQDLNIISAYVLNAYGPTGVMQVAPIAENFTITPVYSQEVLMQFENAETFSPITYGGGNTIFESTITPTTQIGASVIENTCALLYPASIATRMMVMEQLTYKRRLLNFHSDNVTPEDVMVATRMKTPLTNYNSNSTALKFFKDTGNLYIGNKEMTYTYALVPDHGGSELCLDFTLYEQGSNSTPNDVDFGTNLYFKLGNAATANYDMPRVLSWISAFDWHPFMTMAWSCDDVNAGKVYGGPPIGDYDNFTLISDEVLDNMHYYALLSEITSTP